MTPNITVPAKWGRLLPVIWLGLSLGALSGCVLGATRSGASAAAYVHGELEANLDGDYGRVVEAAHGAVGELGFARLSENRDAPKAVLISRTAMDKKVEITVRNSAKKLTNIKIRVGIFGDEQVSRTILDKIKARL